MASKKPSVLIVDNEQMVCDVLYEELSERGYLCTIALDGNGALTKVATEEFAVVLLDIRLPGMSGMEVLREIWLNYPHIATIMITAVNDVDTAVETMKLGATDYIVKPFDLGRVNTSILEAIKSQQAGRPSAQINAIATGVEARLDPFSAYSKVITERTVGIAQQLGIAEEEIQKWAAAKARLKPKREG